MMAAMASPGGHALDPRAVADRLRADWGLAPQSIATLGGGMNSQTWLVAVDGARYVAKAVPVDRRRSFEAGLAVATLVEAGGISAGAPVRDLAGNAVVAVEGFALALLAFVDGALLTDETEEELVLIGSTLERAHRILAGSELPDADPFPWIDPVASHLSLRPWVRPAVQAALAAWQGIPPESLTWAPLHTDPAPEAFRLDRRTGVCGLIDWDLGVIGPLLYDLASAEMYVGGPRRSGPLLRAYLATGALTPGEVERGLRRLATLRWAVQADYFAKRLATNDLTGIGDPAQNERGLEDARQALLG